MHYKKCLSTDDYSKHIPSVSQTRLKGIVHPKMKILSFTRPPVVPNLYECLCSAEHKRYSEECGKQSSSGAPLTSRVFFFSYYGSQWCPQNSLVTNFLQNIFLCVRQNKDIHTGFLFFFFFFSSFFGLSVAQITHDSTYAWLCYHHSQPFLFYFF